MLDPNDPEIARAAAAQGIAEPFLEAARRSPVWKLTQQWQLALPLHPEFRTLPMVWYVPPLSPVAEQIQEDALPAAVDALRIPITYLANLLTAGDEAPVRRALGRLAAMRAFMRSERVEGSADDQVLEKAGLGPEDVRAMYRLLAIAPIEERYVVPTLHRDDEARVHRDQGALGYPVV
jgi:nitrate reductase beta subunit